jgi:apolipoprotein N-acyltransferase
VNESTSVPLRRAAPVALIAGVALSLAFPEADIAPLAWISLAPLLFVLRNQSLPSGFLIGFLFGVGFFGTLLIWISLVGWVAWVLLVLLEASFVGLFGVLFSGLSGRHSVTTALVAAPALWVSTDFLRSLIPFRGFTWGQLAQSQHDLLWMLKPASIGGAWLVTLFLVAINSSIVLALVQFQKRQVRNSAIAAGVGVAILVLPLAVPVNSVEGAGIRAAIAQGNVPRNWDGTSFDKDLFILESHAQLTNHLATEQIDLVVWPESSVGIDPERFEEVGELLFTAARTAGAPLIAGGNSDAGENFYKVMAFFVSPNGSITDRYQKTHLVPFGEYVPARDLLDWIPLLDQIPRDAIAGGEPTLFEVEGGKVAPVLSYEGDFGSLVRGRIHAGGRLLLVITNTSTWGESWASAQHVAFSQLRAVENGVWVGHAAISGISAWIDPTGRVVQSTNLWTEETIIQDVRFATGETLYTRFGDWVPIACGLSVLVLVAIAIRGRARNPSRAPNK